MVLKIVKSVELGKAEARILTRLRKVPHVAQILGICEDDQPVIKPNRYGLCLDYYAHGTLFIIWLD